MNYNDELMHYGVKGMKWGVRRYQNEDGSLTGSGKKRYGMSKREVKRAVKQAKKDYRKNEDPYHIYSGITGKNWADVRSKHRDTVYNDGTIKELREKRDSAYKRAERADRKGDVHLAESYQSVGDINQSKIDMRKSEIGKSFSDNYNEALLKDIGYSDIQKGKKMLKEYGITNKNGRYF